MQPTSHLFPQLAHRAMGDARLQNVLYHHRLETPAKRLAALAEFPEFESTREEAIAIKTDVLNHLSHYLLQFESQVTDQGGQVHWARTAAEANQTILSICREHNAKLVTKGKSMVTEEIGLNEALIAEGIETVETDLGEYIIQLRGEPPSHIIRPAMHLSRAQVAESFVAHHHDLNPDRDLSEPSELLAEARQKLRQKFLTAEIGITGANFLIAETGTTVIVTNEGNGDLTQCLPPVHIVVTGIEKIVPNLESFATILRLLPRSATSQEITAYVTLSTGPRRKTDADGPREFHVVLVDNGRSEMLGSELREMLRCIRCGACLNHCPVFHAVSGHAYGSVYTGPMGAVISPQIQGLEESGHLPNASSFCGRCEEVCPMKIPLPDLMRKWRNRQFERHLGSAWPRWGIGIWGWVAARPQLYKKIAAMAARILPRLLRWGFVPLGGGWLRYRDLPAPEGKSFMALYKKQSRQRE
ncbi:MAG: LutB/LldF family L-lactate oxidation iron-sulfur protein [Candidatus Pacebacteria bacterium]|nr:LutB/LldF family L-lactate oxidation iron-sulfur protein [Candidatus Paceibacterota bacterium]